MRTPQTSKLLLIIYQKDCNIVYTLYNVFLFCFSGAESAMTNTVIITVVCVMAGVVVVTVVVTLVVVVKLRREPPSVQRINTFPISFYLLLLLPILYSSTNIETHADRKAVLHTNIRSKLLEETKLKKSKCKEKTHN